MIRKMLLLAGLALAFTAVVSADWPIPPCAPGCAITLPTVER